MLLIAFLGVSTLVAAEGIDASGLGPLTENTFNQVSTLAQVGVFFLGLIPALLGLAICIVPLQVGASTIAFPRAAAASFWGWLAGSGVLVGSYVANGGPVGGTDDAVTLFLLAWAMVREGLRNVAAGASPVNVRRGMEKAVAQVVKGIESRATAVAGDAIRQVATVSSGGDEEVGRMISEAMAKVSADGVITVEESRSLATELEITEGMAFDRGYSSPYFVTDGDRRVCEYESALLLVTDRKNSEFAIM